MISDTDFSYKTWSMHLAGGTSGLCAQWIRNVSVGLDAVPREDLRNAGSAR